MDERRKKLAGLNFTEKIRILEKLSDREAKLSEARKKLRHENEQQNQKTAENSALDA